MAIKIPERYVLVICCFVAAAICYMDRVGFPLAYTAMALARPARCTDPATARPSPPRPKTPLPAARVPQKAGIDKETQGSVHSAFYYGYTLSQARRTRARLSADHAHPRRPAPHAPRPNLPPPPNSPASPRRCSSTADPRRLGRLPLRRQPRAVHLIRAVGRRVALHPERRHPHRGAGSGAGCGGRLHGGCLPLHPLHAGAGARARQRAAAPFAPPPFSPSSPQARPKKTPARRSGSRLTSARARCRSSRPACTSGLPSRCWCCHPPSRPTARPPCRAPLGASRCCGSPSGGASRPRCLAATPSQARGLGWVGLG